MKDTQGTTPGDEGPIGSLFETDSSRVVSARGTEDGLILRIDGRAEWQRVLGDLEFYLGGRRKFFEGGEVSVEWLDRLPTKDQAKELELMLRNGYGMEIVHGRKREPSSSSEGKTAIPLTDPVEDDSGRKLSWRERRKQARRKLEAVEGNSGFEADAVVSVGDEGETDEFERHYVKRMAEMLGDDVIYEEDANAKVVFGTLRSGQRVETPFSLLVVGDVNPGADLIAGGDIMVFGSLRGTAHASAYDDSNQERVIIALHMQPMQLRIGSVISRGSDEVGAGAEIARIEDRRIVVEVYNPRAFASGRLR